jgi:hypothetical protein
MDVFGFTECLNWCEYFAAIGQGNPSGGFGGVYLHP